MYMLKQTQKEGNFRNIILASASLKSYTVNSGEVSRILITKLLKIKYNNNNNNNNSNGLHQLITDVVL